MQCGSVFAPIIQWVTNLVYQLMKAIQSIVYALFRVNIFANAGAKAYSNMAKGANKAKKEAQGLAGVHDEINNVQTNKNSDSGSGGGGISPDFDLSNLDNGMSEWANKIYEFFKPLKESWDKYGKQVINAFHNAIKGVGKAVSTMWKSVETLFTNGTIYSIISNILNSIGKIGQAWANAWNKDNNGTEIIQSVANIIEYLTQKILELVSSTGFQTFLDGVISAFSGIIQFLEPIIKGFLDMSGVILEIVLSGIGTVFQVVGDILQGIAQNQMAVDILTAVGKALAVIVAVIIAWKVAQVLLNGVLTVFKVLTSPMTLAIMGIVAAVTAVILIIQNWGSIWEWLCEVVGNVCKSIGEFFANLWKGIYDIFSKIGQWFADRFSEAFNGIKNAFSGVIKFFGDVWQGICNVFSGVANWFGNIFSKAWQAVKNVFCTGGKIFDGIKEGIANTFKTIVNGIIGGINRVIAIPFNAINRVLRNIRNINILGISPFTWIHEFNVPQIPQLAKGGVLYNDTVVRVGEYSNANNNPEIVTPQNIMRDTFRDVMSDFVSSNESDDRTLNLSVYVGNEKLGQILLNDLRNMKRQTGDDIEALVGG
jgi:phage-related protein